ncbi:MAG: hypothetical protein ACI865_001324 [Flavobacteriaceae bacterium]|jgi:hypothetical protein
MKNLAVLFVSCILSISATFAGGNPELSEEINQKTIVDLTGIELNQERQDFVIVRLTIVNGAIVIKGVQGSTLELEKIILDKLNSLEIEADCNAGEQFAYKFTFEER